MLKHTFLVGSILLAACSSDAPIGDVARVSPLFDIPGLRFPAGLACEEHISYSRNPENGAEAGLIDGPTGRSFYSYRPSERDLPNDPLLVVFNGDVPVSAYMLGGGTGPSTVVRDGLPLEGVEQNDASWTRFAHVLYLDIPGSGYGYGIRGVQRSTATGDEAAYNLMNLIKFLDCRAPRPDIPVVLAGESQGGARTSRMLWLAQHGGFGPGGPHSEWDEASDVMFDDLLNSHFRRLAEARPEPLDEIRRRQFFATIQIQPALPNGGRWSGESYEQQQFDETFPRAEPESSNGADVERTAAAIVDEAEAMALLGVDISNIEWLRPAFRENAIRREREAPDEPHFLDEVLGSLADGDFYYDLDPFAGAIGDDQESNSLWVDNARDANVLLTDAIRDNIVLSPGIFSILESEGHIRSWEWTDGAGEVSMVTLDGEVVTIPMPRLNARHIVAFDAPVAFADAIEAWLVRLYL